MRAGNVLTQEEIEAQVEDLVSGLTLPGVLDAIAILVGNWGMDAKQRGDLAAANKWWAVADGLHQAYKAAVSHHDTSG